MLARNRLDFFRLGQQHAARYATFLADGCGANGARLVAFRQNDALVCLLGALDQLVAKCRRRQSQLAARHAETGMQEFGLQVLRDEVGNLAGTLDVVRWGLLVQPEEVGCRIVGTCLHGHHRQAAIECRFAQLENARVRGKIAAEQQTCEFYAVERSQARGQNDVVAVARGDHQNAWLQELHRIGDGAGAEHDLVDATLLRFAGMKHLGVEQFGDVARPQSVEFVGERNCAKQLEICSAQQGQLRLEAVDEGGRAVVTLDLVENHAQHFRVLGATEQLGLDLDALGQTLERVTSLRRDQNDIRVQAFRQMRVDS